VKAGKPLQFRKNNYLELLDITHLSSVTKQAAMHCYALRVRGDSMLPFHKDGDILIVEKNSRGKIKHGDTVVWHKEEGSCLKILDLAGNSIKLRPVDFTRYANPEPATSLPQLDKVIFIISA